MANKQMTDLAEVGRDLVDADNFMVNKTRSPLSRVYTYILAKLQAASNIVSSAMFRQSLGTSVVGRSANSTGNVSDIAANSNDTFLQRVGNALTWAGLTIGMVADGLLTRAKLANASGQSVIGRATSGSGAVADISAGTDNRLLGQSGGTLSFLRAALAALADGTALSVIGRSANSSGVYADIAASNDGEILRRAGTTLGFGRLAMAGLGVWPAAAMYRSTAQSITTGGSAQVIDMDTSAYSYGGTDAPTVNTTTNVITIARTGLYRLYACVGMIPGTSVAAGSYITLDIRRNGSSTIAGDAKPAVLNAAVVLHAHHLIELTANDTLDILVFQNTGNAQNTLNLVTGRAALQVEYVGPTT